MTPSEMAKARWAKVPRKERVRQMTRIGCKGGRPRNVDRCPCGKFTAEYAARRRHQCQLIPISEVIELIGQ